MTLIDRARLEQLPDVEQVAEPPAPPRTTALLVALVVLGAVLRMVWIVRNGASFDESFTAMIGRHPLGSVFDALRSTDSHPPLDYLLRLPARVRAPAIS